MTGGTGFLGKGLALKLKELGNDVSILGRNRAIGDRLAEAGLRFLPVDLQDPHATMQACQGQDYVFHCGGLSSPWGTERDFYNANVLGTRHIIQACQHHGVKRLIHVSTSSVYFDFSHRLNISETSPLPKRPANAYTKSKRLAEEAIDLAYRQGLPAIAIRPRGIFGPGDSTIIPRLLRASDRAGIPLINNGQVWLDITYIDNVIDALILCKDAPENLLGRTFNITNGEPINLATLLKMLSEKLDKPLKIKPVSYSIVYGLAAGMELGAKIFGGEPLLTRYTVGLLAFSQTLDITAARKELGYHPRVTIESGLEIFAKWKKNNER